MWIGLLPERHSTSLRWTVLFNKHVWMCCLSVHIFLSIPCFASDGMTFTTFWMQRQNALGSKWWVFRMPLHLQIWRQLRPPESVSVLKLAVCRCAVVTLPGMQQSHRWNRCESSQTSSQLGTSRRPVRADPFKWSCHFITLKESEREREDGERDGESTCQNRALPSLQRSAADELEILRA